MTLRCLLHMLLRQTDWHTATRGDRFVWRRFDCASGQWKERAMTADEHSDAFFLFQ